MRRFLLGLSLLIAIFCIAYPMYVLFPWRAQGALELQLTLRVLESRLWIQLACCIVAGWVAFRQRSRGALLCALAVLAVTAITRINIFERLFHPVREVAFEPVATSHLADREHVLVVSNRAYPVRSLGYHHVVNDWVGGVPLVGTY